MNKFFLLLPFLIIFGCGGETDNSENSEEKEEKVIPPEELAEESVRSFVINLSEGNCDIAKKLVTGNAKEQVQAAINAGCDPFETEIKSVTCQIFKGYPAGTTSEIDENGNEIVHGSIKQIDLMQCECKEERGEMGEMNFIYNLEEVGGKWLISSYEKDLSMQE